MADQIPNYMTQISAGPALGAYKVMNEIIALSNKIESEMAHLSQLEISVQGKAANAAGQAEVTAAQKEANSMYSQMGNSFAGAVINGANLAGQGLGGNKALNEVSEREDGIANQQKELLALKQQPPAQTTVGQGAGAPTAVAHQAEIDARKADLIANGGDTDYTPGNAGGTTNPYGNEPRYFHKGDTANSQPSLDQDAIDSMTPSEYAAFREKLKENIKRHETNSNTASTEKQNNNSFREALVQVAQGLTGGVTQAVSASATAAKGLAQQDQTINRYVEQSTQAAVSQTQGLMATFYQKVAEAIQNAKAAASAYAQ